MKLVIDSLGSKPLNGTLLAFLASMIAVMIITVLTLRLTDECERGILSLVNNPWFNAFSYYATGEKDDSFFKATLYSHHTTFLAMLFSFHPLGQGKVKSLRLFYFTFILNYFILSSCCCYYSCISISLLGI